MGDWHWLRRLGEGRWPARMIYLDVETITYPGGRHGFLLASALCDVLDRDGSYWPASDSDFSSPLELWRWVTKRRGTDSETRVWMHNLDYDLSVSRARACLLELGWRPTAWAIRDQGGWWKWRKGGRLLVLCDSSTFLGNAGLSSIARDLGAEQAELPSSPLDVSGWRERCRGDVWILREALRHVWEWYGHEELGGLMLSGPAQGMAGYRRRWLEERSILCHGDEDVRAWEREATHSGRVEGWRWGRISEPLEEWDYELCYPVLAAGELPVRLLEHGRDSTDYPVTYLAECEVYAGLPLVPAAGGGERGAVFPVGRFRTVLWEPEVELLRRAGQEVELLSVAYYQLGRPLEEWSAWICGTARDHPSPLVRRIAKQWSRTVIGSFGLRFPVWEHVGDDPGAEHSRFDVALSPLSLPDGTVSRLLHLAGEVYQESGVQESDNAVPQIQGYVWSLARVALWEAMAAAGTDNVVYVDTDSLIVTAEGARRLEGWEPPAGLRLRVKARYPWAEILGARQLVLPEGERIAGLKRGSRRVAADRWEGEVWEGFAGGLGRAPRTLERSFTIGAGELHRDRLPAGRTRAVRC